MATEAHLIQLTEAEVTLDRVDEALANGSSGRNEMAHVRTSLDDLIRALHDLRAHTAQWAEGDEDLVRLADIAEENFGLAERGVQSRVAPGDEHHSLVDVSFHLRRALNHARTLDEAAKTVTRRTDRLANQREFMNG